MAINTLEEAIIPNNGVLAFGNITQILNSTYAANSFNVIRSFNFPGIDASKIFIITYVADQLADPIEAHKGYTSGGCDIVTAGGNFALNFGSRVTSGLVEIGIINNFSSSLTAIAPFTTTVIKYYIYSY